MRSDSVQFVNDRLLPGASAGLLGGLFTGAVAGILLMILLQREPAVVLGVGVYAFAGALIGVLIGFVIALTSHITPNTGSARWNWALVAAVAAALAAFISNRFGHFIPLSLLILPIASAVAAWLVEHILLLTTGKQKAKKHERFSSISAYLFGFLSLVVLDLLAILLYWETAGIVA
jgi:hypothetical protein